MCSIFRTFSGFAIQQGTESERVFDSSKLPNSIDKDSNFTSQKLGLVGLASQNNLPIDAADLYLQGKMTLSVNGVWW